MKELRNKVIAELRKLDFNEEQIKYVESLSFMREGDVVENMTDNSLSPHHFIEPLVLAWMINTALTAEVIAIGIVVNELCSSSDHWYVRLVHKIKRHWIIKADDLELFKKGEK